MVRHTGGQSSALARPKNIDIQATQLDEADTNEQVSEKRKLDEYWMK